MPAAKLRPVLAEHDDGAARHVFAAMVTGAFHDRLMAPDRRTAKRSPATPRKKASPRVAPYKRRVAHDDVAASRVAAEVDAWTHRYAATAQALAGVVVGIANQVLRDASGQEGAEALTAVALRSA